MEKIKAMTTKEHYKTFKLMSKKIGLDLSGEKTILGFSKNQIIEKFKQDEHLNNIPLKVFDSWSNQLRYSFNRSGQPYSISNGVCCIKHQIIYNFIGAEFVEITRDPKNPTKKIEVQK